MDRAVETILEELEKREEAERKVRRQLTFDEEQVRQDEFLLSLGRSSAQLMHTIALGAKPKTILEIGGSYGYSTLWLADAARTVGGKLITLEIHPTKQQHARATIANAGLADYVDFRLGNALTILAALSGPIDFVLLDLWKDLYIPCFDLFYPKLSPGAFVVADNMIFPEEQRQRAALYRAHVRTKKLVDSVLLPVGGGLELSRFVPDAG